MECIDVAIIGAGVTGLSAARAIAARGLSVAVLERHARAGLDTSTHNSGVIHGGMYYPTGTLKARLCIEGRHLLYEFSAAHGVPHKRCGKLIVASEDREMTRLIALHAQGVANGVEGLVMADRRFIAAREPAVHAVGALYSPETGIIDAEALVRTLVRDGEASGVAFLPGTQLVGADSSAGGIALRTARETIVARQVVNAAGLYADEVSRMLGGEAFTIYPARGEYAELAPARRSSVNGLVYPLPNNQVLGVHLIKTLAGAVWLGPTVKYLERKDDYESDRLPVEAFVEPAQRLLDGITPNDLRLSGSGIRAKLNPTAEMFADFLIRRDRRNPAIVQAAGIDSPGLTSCLAIGRLVAEIVVQAA
jgi:L-2-hydroxyglutarate oxidase LhgO